MRESASNLTFVSDLPGFYGNTRRISGSSSVFRASSIRAPCALTVCVARMLRRPPASFARSRTLRSPRDSSRVSESSGIHGFSGTHRLFGATGLHGVHEFSGTHRDRALYGIPSGKPASSSELQDLRVLRKGALTWKPRLPSVFRYPACSTSSSQCSNSLTRCLAPRWSHSVDPKT
jgi:hypothetical protein